MEKYVITISREFGSLGRSIAQKMSEMLGIEFYDRDIVEATAKRMGLPVSLISNKEENAGSVFFKRQYPLGMGLLHMQNEIFCIQENIIRDLAAKESCIIVGRCADSILQDYKRSLHIYIYAPYEARYKNCTETLKMDDKTARKMIREVDRAREEYRLRYCPKVRDMFDNRDIMMDSSRFGVEGTAKILTQIVKEMFYE